MIEIRLHGLGGQGIVTAAELIAMSAWSHQLWSQSVPFFGPERTGAPVQAFVRLDHEPIRLRQKIYEPDWLIIREDKLLANLETTAGLKRTGKILINSRLSQAEIKDKLPKNLYGVQIFSFDAQSLAKDLGTEILTTTILIGAFGQVAGCFDLLDLQTAIKEKFADKTEAIIKDNLRASVSGFKVKF